MQSSMPIQDLPLFFFVINIFSWVFDYYLRLGSFSSEFGPGVGPVFNSSGELAEILPL